MIIVLFNKYFLLVISILKNVTNLVFITLVSFDFYQVTNNIKIKINKNLNKNDNMNLKSLICIYTNKDKNEFAIGLKKDENFRAMTRVGEFYTRFVDAYDQIIDENEIEWNQELKRWIHAAKKNETIFVEVDLSRFK